MCFVRVLSCPAVSNTLVTLSHLRMNPRASSTSHLWSEHPLGISLPEPLELHPIVMALRKFATEITSRLGIRVQPAFTTEPAFLSLRVLGARAYATGATHLQDSLLAQARDQGVRGARSANHTFFPRNCHVHTLVTRIGFRKLSETTSNSPLYRSVARLCLFTDQPTLSCLLSSELEC